MRVQKTPKKGTQKTPKNKVPGEIGEHENHNNQILEIPKVTKSGIPKVTKSGNGRSRKLQKQDPKKRDKGGTRGGWGGSPGKSPQKPQKRGFLL